MGIFAKVQQMRADLKDRRKIRQQEKIEHNMKMLKMLKSEAKLLDKEKALRDSIMRTKGRIREAKHPVISKLVKNTKANIKKGMDDQRMTDTNIFLANQGKPNPFFASGGKPNPIFHSSPKKNPFK